MNRTIDDPCHFIHQSSDYNNDDDDSSSESVDFQPQIRKHFCVICTKQFSCGKAYGGHVRIHSSEYNNKGKAKKIKMKKRKIGLVKKEKEIALIRADVEGKIRCCLCCKEFQTLHSLFGHMRRHPDRSWKGIRPPPPEKLKLSFLDDNDDDVISRSMVMTDVTEDVQGAACCLMMLHCAETSTSELRSSSCYNDDKGTEKGKKNGEMDDKGSTVDMKMKMEIKVKVNNPQDEARKRSLGFDLNQPYHDQDHPYSN
ncbi:hypothetical protein Bca4012_018576 [Brassica carinata]|uniref:C2H2-type domain-containing protein n=1 Tax=Brassica carinata TaxID=52824 RepID=A0A8X8BEE5_BRACI|nr:hypothetical protein Bca52824_003035 [Brassica carinata]